MNKSVFILLLALLLVPMSYATEFFTLYDLSYSHETPNTVYVRGAECSDTSCTNVNSREVVLYNGNAVEQCLIDHNTNAQAFLSCAEQARISGNVIQTSQMDTVAVKETIPSTFGYVTQFFASEDSYYPEYYRNFDYSCNNPTVCVNGFVPNINFGKGINVIAEIQQLNVLNTDNPLFPIQIEVPVEIEETVCSAYQYSDPDLHKFQPPSGYSDYSANTKIDLRISQVNGDQTLSEQSVTVPILAETCDKLQTFTWQPNANLLNEEVKFRVESEVVDNQVLSSNIDWAQVIETVYPSNLENTAYVNIHDMTLSNEASFDLNSGVSQIIQGEDLYLGYLGGAFRFIDDNTQEPINYDVKVLIDDVVVSTDTQNSGPDMNLDEYFVDLSDEISGFSPGNYTVTIHAEPICPSCSLAEDVEVSQNLEIIALPKAEVQFTVIDTQSNPISGASVNFLLTQADGSFSNPPTFDQTQNTNSQGETTFTQVPYGEYTYTVSKEGFTSKTRDVTVGSDMQITVVLGTENVGPQIDLPAEFTEMVGNVEVIELELYISDPDNSFSELTLTSQVISGAGSASIVNGELRVTSNIVGDTVVRVNVEDPSGLNDQDSTVVHFVDNEEPFIVDFSANPDSGEAPLFTQFNVEVEDPENDNLECTIIFGDSSTTGSPQNCENLDGIGHTYQNVGTYTATLNVYDGSNPVVQAQETINVFEVQQGVPIIDFFTLTSSNGSFVPTDLSFAWQARHTENLSISCLLEINGNSQSVPCNENDFNVDNYNIEGVGIFAIYAIDTNGLIDSETITRTFERDEENLAPLVDLQAFPNTGEAPLEVEFAADANDPEGENVECFIDFGDGISSNMFICDQFVRIDHTYNNPGIYTATLIGEDPQGNVGTDSVLITVEENQTINSTPVVEEFNIISSNGNFVPTNLSINWIVTHTQNLSMTCTLTINGNVDVVPCIGSEFVQNFDLEGTSTFTIRGIDINGESDSETIVRTFTRNDTENEAPIVDLIADENQGEVPHLVTFTADVVDPDGDLTSCVLDFGDGTQTQAFNCDNFGQRQHIYTQEGVYNAVLSATDTQGAIGTDIEVITVIVDQNNSPIVDLSAIPTSGNEPLDVDFTAEISDPDNDLTSCILEFGEGSQETLSCSAIETTDFTYFTPGVYVATLTATDSLGNIGTDSVTITVNDVQMAPVVNLNATPTSGDEDLFVSFSSSVVDPDGDQTFCTLDFGDGSAPVSRDCDVITPENHIYVNPGVYTATLTATDVFGNVGSDSVAITVNDVNDDPFVLQFDATPQQGIAPLDVTFTYQLEDPEGSQVFCSLNFGDGSAPVTGRCDTLQTMMHTYTSPGTYIATLSGNDDQGNTVSAQRTIVVEQFSGPVVEEFNVNSNNNIFVPANLSIDWRVVHTDGLNMTCTLEINGNDQIVPCIGTTQELNFNVEGTSTFTITGVDINGISDSETLTRDFISESRNVVDIELDIDEVIQPGEFDFRLLITDEGLKKRLVSVEPVIFCNGLQNRIGSFNGKLDTRAVSSSDSSIVEYEFVLDTQDFELTIPKDEQCEFRVELMDEYGTVFDVLSSSVMFKYETQETKYASIRGNSFDVVDFMRNTLLREYGPGYHVIEFAMENNDGVDKDVSVGVISRDLGINVYDSVTLDSKNQIQTRIQVPIFIPQDTKAGYYPIRISANVEGNKQVKYSYINIVEE